jgi:hypothetical protein
MEDEGNVYEVMNVAEEDRHGVTDTGTMGYIGNISNVRANAWKSKLTSS